MDKQTQKERLLKLFADNGNILSLGQIMKTDLAAEYRARISELRNERHEYSVWWIKKSQVTTYTRIMA